MGDKETRIDADASGTILICTTVSEKETGILGSPGKAELISGSQIFHYLENQTMERYVKHIQSALYAQMHTHMRAWSCSVCGIDICIIIVTSFFSKNSSTQDLPVDSATSPQTVVGFPTSSQ